MMKNKINISKLSRLFSEENINKNSDGKSSNKDNLINGLDTTVKYKKIGNYEIIYSINDKVMKNSYIVSPYNLIINYGREEIYKIGNKLTEMFYFTLINILSIIFKITKIDKNVYINNLLLSTNFYTKEWDCITSNDMLNIENDLKSEYKNHALVFRSVNKYANENLYEVLINKNWLKVSSRQVYLLKDKNKTVKRQNYKVDVKLLDSKRYLFVDINKDDDNQYKEAIKLYNKLYLEKYSEENVQFNWKYLKKMNENNMIHMKFVFDKETNKNVGILGIIGSDNIITAPIVGYDTEIDIKEGIYRRIIIYIIKYAIDNNLELNLSSGAPDFKKLRGLEPEIEYTFVKVDHLNFFRRSIWKILSFFSINFYEKMLIKLKL